MLSHQEISFADFALNSANYKDAATGGMVVNPSSCIF
jgi:hypothetical protein